MSVSGSCKVSVHLETIELAAWGQNSGETAEPQEPSQFSSLSDLLQIESIVTLDVFESLFVQPFGKGRREAGSSRVSDEAR
jgi:hypothetical protein